MKLKDIEMFWKSVLHSRSSQFFKDDSCWWDTANKKDLEKMVQHLSDPDTHERKIIREILLKNNIHSVMDAGCGVGTELEGYKANNIDIEYTGMESSKFMLEIAKKRYPDYKFVYGDINKIPFEDNSFDAVILKHVLEHLPGYQSAINEAVRVASKIVIIDFFHKLWLFDFRRKHKDGFWENWYSKRKFEKFIYELPISNYKKFSTIGTSRQTAEIYVLNKQIFKF